jgi:hypothetical protein
VSADALATIAAVMRLDKTFMVIRNTAGSVQEAGTS